MENATKALMIAAAVLIAILIISLGLVIYNKATEAANNAGDLGEAEMQQRNEKFLKYEGENVSGKDVNAMLQTVINHNMAQENSANTVKVFLGTQTIISADRSPAKYPKKFPTYKTYRVKCYIGENTKRIRKIDIWEND